LEAEGQEDRDGEAGRGLKPCSFNVDPLIFFESGEGRFQDDLREILGAGLQPQQCDSHDPFAEVFNDAKMVQTLSGRLFNFLMLDSNCI
jgi:hypothetical protein